MASSPRSPARRCPHCGASMPPGGARCVRCRRSVDGDAATQAAPYAPPARTGPTGPVSAARPGAITAMAILNFVSGGFSLFAGAMVVFAAIVALGGGADGDGAGVMIAVASVYLIPGTLLVLAGIGLMRMKGYGRTLQIILSCIGLIAIPLGTLVSIFYLVYLFKPGIKVLFSGTGEATWSPEERAAVASVQQSSAGVVVAIVVGAFFIFVALIGIIAAIAIPSLLRARVSANEAQAIGDLRSTVSAQQSYASMNGGYFGSPECLIQPASCIENLDPATPPLLSADMFGSKSGYIRTLYPGPSLAQDGPIGASLESYAVSATPVNVGTTGMRSFCASESGLMCSLGDGSDPIDENGRCRADCTPLQ